MELHITSPDQPTTVVNNHHQGLLHIHSDPHYHQHYQTENQPSQIAIPQTESDVGHWNTAACGAQVRMASSSLPSSNASSTTHISNSATSPSLVHGEMLVTGQQSMLPPGTDTPSDVKPKRDFRFQTPKWFIMPTHGSKHRHHKKDEEDQEEEIENTERQEEAKGHKENSNSSSSTASTSTPSQLSSSSVNSDGSGGDGVLKNSSDQENVRPVVQQSSNSAKQSSEISQQGILLQSSMMCASNEPALVPNNFDNPLNRSSLCMNTVHCGHWETNSAFEILAVSDPKSEEEMAEDDYE